MVSEDPLPKAPPRGSGHTPGVGRHCLLLSGGSDGKVSACNEGDRVRSLGQDDSLEKEMATHSGTLAWKVHGRRNLIGSSPWGHKESDTTE